MKLLSKCFVDLQRRARLLLAALVLGAGVLAVFAAPPEDLSESALQQIGALLDEKASRTPAQLKLDSQLLYAVKRSRNEVIAPGVDHLRVGVAVDGTGTVEVDIAAAVSPELLDFIRQAGGTVLNSHARFNAIRARIPLAFVETLAGRSDVRFIREGARPEYDAGSVSTEGDATHGADVARATFGVNGSGVKVGVLSDSVDWMSNSQATGDLPPNVTVLPGQGGFGSGEGTAMLEIIHDIAPGAQLFFATAGGGEANFAQNILNLRAVGCDIIVDDVRYFTEPPLQDGIVGQAVNSVTADGAIYFASAGNAGNKLKGTSGTWEGDFVDGGDVGAPVNGRGGRIHSFGATTYNTLTRFSSQGFIGLWWADALGTSTNDYDLFLLDSSGNNVIASSTTTQNGTQDAMELLFGGDTGERIVVVKVSGDARFLHIDTGRGRLEINTDGFARGHSMAAEAYATAAVDVAPSYPNLFNLRNTVEDFSSDGPRRIFFEPDGTPVTPGNYLSSGGKVRQTPVLAAADGVTTTVPGFAPFFGTSAAAPHAAAIAALVKSLNPNLTPAQMRTVLTSSCLDIELAGVDNVSGYGILMAPLALQNTPPPVPLPNLVLVTNVISGGNGNGVIDFNECNNLDLVLTNLGNASATGVRVTLTTTTPGVTLARRTSDYPNIPIAAGGTNLLPFRISTAPTFICGRPIELVMTIKTDQVVTTNILNLPTGVPGTTLRFDNNTLVPIPNGLITGTNSSINVSNINFSLSKVVVSLHVTHSYDANLTLKLVAPDGTECVLSSGNGGGGQNYGLGCFPDSIRTTFDDAAATSIGAGGPPFPGAYKPQEPLAVFFGKAGTNVNGVWKLVAIGASIQDVGAIQCWSLLLTPAFCVDGGGECPGSDLALGMVAQPDPVMVGGLLTYTISVTNFGPSAATNVSMSHLIPSTAQFISATPSQGGASHSGGVVSCNLGMIVSGGRASVTVVVAPTTPGLVSSSATVSSEQQDFDLLNNTATVLTRVNPLTADLAVGMVANPVSTFIGNPLTYSVSVTNFGPGTAAGVVVSNVLPASVGVTGATVSQGNVAIYGNVVVCTFATLTNGARASATIQAVPTAEGTIQATAQVRANTFDPVAGNDTATASVVVGPAADLALGLVDNPDPVVINSNLTYVINVTNLGPSVAEGVVVNATLPTGVILVSNYTSLGTISVGGNTVTADIGTFARGATALIVLQVRPPAAGTIALTANISGTQTDPNLVNNTATVTTLVAAPFVSIAGAGVTLTVESVQPPNGAVDNGETVTAILRLRNAGNVSTTNLTATLLATNGITPQGSATQVYRVLAPGDFPVGRSFTFSANGTDGGSVTAVLELQDGPTVYPPVSFTFGLPTVRTFANTNAITIRDNTSALPYPSTIAVSGLSGVLGKVTATLVNASHTFPQDVDVLLAAPTNQARTLLMAGAGAPPLANATVTFDALAAEVLPDNTSQILSGSYQPASYLSSVTFPAPAPPGPYSTALSQFNGINPNGSWSLYVSDHTAGDVGSIAGGWALNLTMLTPVNKISDVGITAVSQPNPCVAGFALTNVFSITNAGPDAATFVAFTNWLPAGVEFVSATASQGAVMAADGMVFANLGSLNTGVVATVTVVLVPEAAAAGVLTSTATVSATETDLNPNNNSAAAVATVNLPSADLALALTATPDPVLLNGLVTFTAAVTNHGPQLALDTVLTNVLPAGQLGSIEVSAGSVEVVESRLVWRLGDLAAGTDASLSFVLGPTNSGWLTNSAWVVSRSTDPAPQNNAAAYGLSVLIPAPAIVAAKARLVSESFSPPNGAIDNGETVTVSLGLQNVGSASTFNLEGVLQASGGVTPVVASRNYGVVASGGPAVSRDFTFQASGPGGGMVVASLRLTDGASDLGSVQFAFNLPGTATFSNSAAITIPERGPALPYPSVINVTGLTGAVSKVTVGLNGLTHSFPRDVNALLVSPSGKSTLLMSHVGGGYAVTNLSLLFDDLAVELPTNRQITNGTYRPTRFGAPVSFRSPAPVPPYGTTLAGLAGSEANGAWLLYLLDDSGGDAGVVAGGWSLTITTIAPINALTDVAVGLAVTPASAFTGQLLASLITVTNFGPELAEDIFVTNTLPPGVVFESASPSEGVSYEAVAGTVVWAVGSLPAGTAAQVSVVTKPTLAGSLTNRVVAVSGGTDLALGNNAAQTVTMVYAPLPARLSGELTDSTFRVTLTGQSGLRYEIQASPDLRSWTAIGEGVAPFTLVDTNVPSFNARFYRGVRLLP